MNLASPNQSPGAAILEATEQVADLSFGKARTSSAPTLDGLRVAPEIFQLILSYLIADGLQLSNDPEFESDIETIRSLLGTTRWTRNEILRRPLTIYITEGGNCGCEAVASMKSHNISTPLADRIRHIPLHLWPEVVLKIVPGVRHQPCTFDWTPMLGHLLDPEAEPPDPMAREFMLAFYCVLQQSQIIALTIKAIYDPPALKDKPLQSFLLNPKGALKQEDLCRCDRQCCRRESLRDRLKTKIVFQRPRRVQLADQTRIPLWDSNMVFDLLGPWRWTAESSSSSSSQCGAGIVLPSLFLVPMQHPGRIWKSVLNASAPIKQAFPHHPERFVDLLPDRFCEAWSAPLYHAGGIEPWCDADFIGAHNIYGREWYYSNEPLSASPTDYTVYGHTILRVRIPQTAADEEGVVTPNSRWEGEFLGTDYPLDRNGQLHTTRVHDRRVARRAAAEEASKRAKLERKKNRQPQPRREMPPGWRFGDPRP